MFRWATSTLISCILHLSIVLRSYVEVITNHLRSRLGQNYGRELADILSLETFRLKQFLWQCCCKTGSPKEQGNLNQSSLDSVRVDRFCELTTFYSHSIWWRFAHGIAKDCYYIMSWKCKVGWATQCVNMFLNSCLWLFRKLLFNNFAMMQLLIYFGQCHTHNVLFVALLSTMKKSSRPAEMASSSNWLISHLVLRSSLTWIS